MEVKFKNLENHYRNLKEEGLIVEYKIVIEDNGIKVFIQPKKATEWIDLNFNIVKSGDVVENM